MAIANINVDPASRVAHRVGTWPTQIFKQDDTVACSLALLFADQTNNLCFTHLLNTPIGRVAQLFQWLVFAYWLQPLN